MRFQCERGSEGRFKDLRSVSGGLTKFQWGFKGPRLGTKRSQVCFS